jgi:hypothetical protein
LRPDPAQFSLLLIDIVGVNKLNGVRTRGRLVLVDLAGSERLDKSGAVGSRMKEAQNINKYVAWRDVVWFAGLGVGRG